MATNQLDLFSYLPGLEVTETELLESELAVQQILQAKFPTLDLREGTALRDLNIRPNATLLGLINKALTFYFQNNTLSEVTDATPEIFVDKLMSNWFLERKLGINAIISARLYFAKAKNVSLYTDTFFSTDGVLRFYPISSTTFSSSDLVFEAAANQYYIDVDLIAESAGTDYNISAGSLLYFTNFDPFFLRAEINYLREKAQDPESNTDFIARAKNAISTRNNINVPSIDSNLTDNFTALTETKVVGMGDPEMTRDQIKVLIPGVTDPVWIHNGGKVDVYCRTPLASSIIQVNTDANGKAEITGSIYKLERSKLSGGILDDTLPLYIPTAVSSVTRTGSVVTVTCASPHGYSTGDKITILGANQTGYNGEFDITVTGANTFTYVVTTTPVTPATGTITANKLVPFTTKNSYTLSVTPSSITRVGSVVTVQYANHGLMVGDRVTISGAAQTDYNGTFVVESVTDRDRITYSIATTPATPATGTLVLSYVDRYNDVGFSDRQVLTVDFGSSTYGNKTVSFIIYYHENIDGYQEYLSSSNTRVICGDLLSRGFNLCLLDLVITGYNGPAPDAETCNNIAIDYLASLSPGQHFVMADLLAKLYAGGITTIKTPVDVTYTKYWNDLLSTTTGTITDVHNSGDSCNVYMVNTVTTTSEAV